MGLRFECARAISAVSTWGLKNVFHRPAANFPGKVALYADPKLIADLRPRLTGGSICVVGTNGKTTVTNILADAFEAAGKRTVCNRTGANLDSGVATALLHSEGADWGVFECDELWLAKILPYLQSEYVVLLNLFRDQLDRSGEIDHIQQSIVGALQASPGTVLVYNADDPLCQGIAEKAGNPCVPFGIGEDLHLPPDTVVGGRLCQRCSTLLEYSVRQYGQLGDYRCPNCGFHRPALRYAAVGVQVGERSLEFDVAASPEPKAGGEGVAAEARSAAAGSASAASAVSPVAGGASPKEDDAANAPASAASESDDGASPKPADSPAPAATPRPAPSPAKTHVWAPFPGVYMVYNLLAAFAACAEVGVPAHALQKAITEFDPKNGRLQLYQIDGRAVMLNLAKNPTGFNRNLSLVLQHPGPKGVAFFINDKEADGHDVSWLWDVDFQELANDPDVVVYAGGLRRNDMQVRLKYAGVNAQLIDGAKDMLDRMVRDCPEGDAFLIANYTALPGVKAELDRKQQDEEKMGYVVIAEGTVPMPARSPKPQTQAAPGASATASPSDLSDPVEAIVDALDVAHDRPFVIAHLFPNLLNLYGDGGNVTVLADRVRRRGYPVRVDRVDSPDGYDLSKADLVFLGGGPDREQRLAQQYLTQMRDQLRDYVENDGVLLAICGGYQIIGDAWLMGGETVDGLGLVDLTTKRAEGGSHNRLVGNIVLKSELAHAPVVGFENHAGRTFLGPGLKPFGMVEGSVGFGNNDSSGADGVVYKNLVGSYLHGPLLAKNPEIADTLIKRAYARRAWMENKPMPKVGPLDDAEELAANEYMLKRLKVKQS